MIGHQDGADEETINWFEEMTTNASLVQKENLKQILEKNFGTEYLKKFMGDLKFEDLDISRLESLYASMVPLASHADFEPYIQRIADGDCSPILTQEPMTTLSLSSGTTEGRPKYVPFTHFSSLTTLQMFRFAAAYRSRYFSIRSGGRILEFIYSSKQFQTKGGLQVGTATTHYFASPEFKKKQATTKSFTCSPYEVISGGDYKQSTYCHLLLGLLFSHQVEFVTSTFSYSIIQAFREFEENWEEICKDIKEGTLSSKIDIPKMRKSVSELLSPNPTLSSKIEEKCKKMKELNWFSVIPQLWPNAKYVYSILTGSMEPYLKKLRHYAGDLPLVGADYGSTECWIGVNMDPCAPPEKVTFTVVPSFAYFEFIPLYRQREESVTSMDSDYIEGQPLPLSQVKVGELYEIVLTTFTGLYRYRLGDVVQVAGFHNKSPQLTFICRRKLILTVNIDKNTERDLQLSVECGSHLLSQSTSSSELLDFTSHVDLTHTPGHYVIYWELAGKDAGDIILGECCRKMDESFTDHGYVVSRRSNSIGPLELRIVEKGTFKKILDHFIGRGAAMSQFKTPRCTRDGLLLAILNRCTVKRFFSTAYR